MQLRTSAFLPVLAEDLNRLIMGPSLYGRAVFPAATLKKSTQNLLVLVKAKGQPQIYLVLNRSANRADVFPG